MKKKAVIMIISFYFLSCMTDRPNKRVNSDANFKISNTIKNKKNVITFLTEYSFSESHPSSNNNYQIPNLPKLDSLYISELFDLYNSEIYKDTLKRLIPIIFLKLYKAELRCCGQSYPIINNVIKVDSLKYPLKYLYLDIIDKNTPEIIYGGVGSFSAYSWIKKDDSWKNDLQTKNIILEIDTLLNKRLKSFLTTFLKSEKIDCEEIKGLIREGEKYGWYDSSILDDELLFLVEKCW